MIFRLSISAALIVLCCALTVSVLELIPALETIEGIKYLDEYQIKRNQSFLIDFSNLPDRPDISKDYFFYPPEPTIYDL